MGRAYIFTPMVPFNCYEINILMILFYSMSPIARGCCYTQSPLTQTPCGRFLLFVDYLEDPEETEVVLNGWPVSFTSFLIFVPAAS